MESLGDILRRVTRDATSRNTLGYGEGHQETEKPEGWCPVCGGNGWVERRVPLGHPDFGELFPCRHTSQDKGAERIQLLQRYSGLHKEMLNRMTFERFVLKRYNLDSQGQSSLEAAYTAATDFAKTLEGWLLITGSHGSGKTHLAVAVVEKCIRKGYPSLFSFVPDLLDHLRAAFSPDSPVRYDQLFDQVKSVPLLILDDLGAESSTSWAKEKLYQIVVHRHNARMPTVITTYLSMEEIRAVQPHLASRLLDATLVNWVPIGAPDYRNQGRIDQQESRSRRF